MILAQRPERLNGLQIQLTIYVFAFFLDAPHYFMVVWQSKFNIVGPAAATTVKTWPAEQKQKKY